MARTRLARTARAAEISAEATPSRRGRGRGRGRGRRGKVAQQKYLLKRHRLDGGEGEDDEDESDEDEDESSEDADKVLEVVVQRAVRRDL